MRKIILLSVWVLFIFNTGFANVEDTILNVTFDANYITDQGWNTWNILYPADSTPDKVKSGWTAKAFAPGFGIVVEDIEATGTPFGIVSGKLIWGQTDWFWKDTWLTYKASGLEVGQQYKIETMLTTGQSHLCSYTLAAWDATADTPADEYVPNNCLICDDAGTHTNEVLTQTIQATSTDMYFAIGAGRSGSGATYKTTQIHYWRINKELPRKTISYRNIGTKNRDENPTDYNATDEITLVAAKDSSGYLFAGWFYDDVFNDTVNTPAIAQGSTSDITFYAQWKVAEIHTVTYNANGGVDGTITSEVVNNGGQALLSGNPSREGYEFTAWTNTMDGNVDTIGINNVIISDTTLYAQWEYIPLKDTILDVVFNQDYMVTQNNWTHWQTLTDNIPMQNLGFDLLKSDMDAADIIMSRQDYILFGQSGSWVKKDAWFIFETNGIEVGAKYSVQVELQVLESHPCSYTLGAWSKGNAPDLDSDYVSATCMLCDVGTTSDTTLLDSTIQATASTMTFGIGMGRENNQTYKKTKIISWSIIRKSGIPTVLDNTDNASFTLYPNPTENRLHISGISDRTDVRIYNTTGKLVISTKASSIDVSELSSGIYYVEAENKVKPFVKK